MPMLGNEPFSLPIRPALAPFGALLAPVALPAQSGSSRSGRAGRWDLAEHSAHAGLKLAELARRNISFLWLRAGALGEERGHADLGIFGFEGHAFLGEREAVRCSFKRASSAWLL